MQKNLFLSPISKNHYHLKDKVLFGKCCLANEINESKIDDYKLTEYLWNDSNKLREDYDYLSNLYYRIISTIFQDLNQFHKVKKSKRFWHIVVGSWVYKFLICAYNKWVTLNSILSKQNKFNIYNYDIKPKDIIPSDFLEFDNFSKKDYWNNSLSTEIIKFTKKKQINFINLKYEIKKKRKYEINQNLSNGKFIYRAIDKILSFFSFKPNIILFQTYFSKKINLNLFLKFRTFPRLFYEFEKNLDLPNPNDRSKLKLNINTRNQFENFLSKKIFSYMPISYLEGFNKIDKFQKKIKYNPSLIISAVGEFNDLFSIWAATKVDEKVLYFYSEHGGYTEDLQKFSSCVEKYDLFLSWNYSTKKKSIQIEPQFYTKKFDNTSIPKANNLSVIMSGTGLYTSFIHNDLKADQCLESYNELKKLKSISARIKNNLKFRLHPVYSSHWSIKERILNDFGKKFICKEKKIDNSFLNSKLIILDDLQTSFYQAMNSERPLLVFSLRELNHNVNTNIVALLKEMKKEKIILNNYNDLKIQIEKIWDDPFGWWSSKNIMKLRSEFKKLCSKTNENTLANKIYDLHKFYEKKA